MSNAPARHSIVPLCHVAQDYPAKAGTHITAVAFTLAVFIKYCMVLTCAAAFALASVVVKVGASAAFGFGIRAQPLTCTRGIVKSVPFWTGFLLTLATALVCIPLVSSLAFLVSTFAATGVGVYDSWADTRRWRTHTSAGVWVNNLISLALQ